LYTALLLLFASREHMLIAQTIQSARVFEIGETPGHKVSSVLQIAPGAAPLVSFRYFEGKQRHRFPDLDLVIDDAGH